MRVPTEVLAARPLSHASLYGADPVPDTPCCGHEHLWHSVLSRRQFMGLAAGAAGAAVVARFWIPALAQAAPMGGPKPIPGGISMPPMKATFHVFLPESGNEPSTITDFDGIVGVSNVQGTCTRTRLKDGSTSRLLFDTDMRFMKGKFVGADGKTSTGTFGFV